MRRLLIGAVLGAVCAVSTDTDSVPVYHARTLLDNDVFRSVLIDPLVSLWEKAEQGLGISNEDVKFSVRQLLDQQYEQHTRVVYNMVLEAFEIAFANDWDMLDIIQQVEAERSHDEDEQHRQLFELSPAAKALLDTNKYQGLMYRLWMLDSTVSHVVLSDVLNQKRSWFAISSWIRTLIRRFSRGNEKHDKSEDLQPSEDQLQEEIETLARTLDVRTYEAFEELIRYQFTESDRAYQWLIDARKAHLEATDVGGPSILHETGRDVPSEFETVDEGFVKCQPSDAESEAVVCSAADPAASAEMLITDEDDGGADFDAHAANDAASPIEFQTEDSLANDIAVDINK